MHVNDSDYDIKDQEYSLIFEHLQSNNIDNSFFTTFCEQVREIENQGSLKAAIQYNTIQ